ncbi:MAG: FMN-binding protein [Clostridia bacterium]|nr:FMN-binding protein [Clostridia bacterium]
MKKKAGWLVLAIIAVVAGSLLAFANQITEEPIRKQNLERTHGALTELFPQADRFDEIALADGDELLSAYTASGAGQTIGYAATIASQGYAGPVEVVVGLDTGFVLRGIRVGGSDFKETEGLGSRAKEPAFTDQFQGKIPPLGLGQEIDGISGATITSSAVVEGVNQASDWVRNRFGAWQTDAAPQSAAPAASPAPEGRTANASVIGYAGPVLVRLTLDEANRISALTIGGERMQETPGLGARVAEDAFAAQFVGLTPPVQESQVELIGGATISSRAAVEAINQAAAFLMEEGEKETQ